MPIKKANIISIEEPLEPEYGIESKCPYCGVVSWVGIDEYYFQTNKSSRFTCEECYKVFIIDWENKL